jgi:putative nucleotidyltransferase with HDIG domain
MPASNCISILLVYFALSVPLKAADNRDLAWKTLTSHVTEKKHLTHALAVEAIMRAMAGKQDNVDEWGLTGLLHDVDIVLTKDDMSRHGAVGAQILKDAGFSEKITYAINAHDDRTSVPRRSRMDHALFCADLGYWLMLAAAPAYPSPAFDAASPDQLWEKARTLPSKRQVVPQIAAECEMTGFKMPQVFAIMHRELKNLRLP